MRALTITQPWASLVACGAKRIETRSWMTSHRGPLAIHAAKTYPREAQDLGRSSMVRRCLADQPLTLPLGVVIATCVLLDCAPTELMKWAPPELPTDCLMGKWPLGFEMADPAQEYCFGNYEPNRFAWLLGSIERLPEPDPAVGKLQLWEWDEKAYWYLQRRVDRLPADGA